MKNLLSKIIQIGLVLFSLALLSAPIKAQTYHDLGLKFPTTTNERPCGPPDTLTSPAVLSKDPNVPSPVPVNVTLSGGRMFNYDIDGWRYISYNPKDYDHCGGINNGFAPSLHIEFSRGVYAITMHSNVSGEVQTITITGTTGNQRTYIKPASQEPVDIPGIGETLGKDIGLIKEITISAEPSPYYQNWEIQLSKLRFALPETDSPTPGLRAPIATDSSFVITDHQGLNTGCTYRADGSLKIDIPIKRVVGDVDGSSGKLVNPQELVNNRVVSRYAVLRLPAWDVNYLYGERDRVLVNGVDIGPLGTTAYLKGGPKRWEVNEFLVPIELIRFGKRIKGQPSIPGNNTVEIRIDDESKTDLIWCTSIAWASISFQAMYPVVMIHGNNSCGEFFAGDYDCDGQPQADFAPSEFFTYPFEQKRIPYDNSIHMTTNTVAENGKELNFLIPRVAAEFGAKHLHLVAHSKGGLDTRKFLTLIQPGTLGVLSLFTISTPHNGSVGADYIIDAHDPRAGGWKVAGFSDNWLRALLAANVDTDRGTPDLRVSQARKFNLTNYPLLPKTFTVDGETNTFEMFATGGDANADESTDGSGYRTISENETRGMPGLNPPFPFPPTFLKADIYQVIYDMLGEVHSTRLVARTGGLMGGIKWGIQEIPESPFQVNDFLVTRSSANASGPGLFYGNHASVVNSVNAKTVIAYIQQAIQPIN
jgi:hypothetical protein